MNKNNKNILLEFLNQYFISEKNILFNNIRIFRDTKDYDVILLLKTTYNNETKKFKITYLNELEENDIYYKDYYDKSIEKVTEYIYYVKNYLNNNIQNILFNDFDFNNRTLIKQILIGAALYLFHSNYFSVFVENNNENEYIFIYLNKS